MKYICVPVMFFISMIMSFVYAYQQQGFLHYQENGKNIEFLCGEQCFTIIGSNTDGDYLHIEGKVQGKGLLGYGFLVGEQIIPGEIHQFDASNGSNFDNDFVFSKAQVFSQIPDNSQIVVIMQGNFQGNFSPTLNNLSLGKRGIIGRKDFWRFDSFKPYTINLLKGPIIFGESANTFFYGFLILGALFFILRFWYNKKKIIKYILILFAFLWFFYDARMGLESIKYYYDDYKNYISKPQYKKIYRDRGDFYSFVNFTNNTLNNTDIPKYETIGFYTDNKRPFPGSMKYFLYPYNIKINTPAKYIIVYGSSKTTYQNNQLYIDNTVYGIGDIYSFSPNAFIFMKK